MRRFAEDKDILLDSDLRRMIQRVEQLEAIRDSFPPTVKSAHMEMVNVTSRGDYNVQMQGCPYLTELNLMIFTAKEEVYKHYKWLAEQGFTIGGEECQH